MSMRTEKVAEQLLGFLGAEVRGVRDPRAILITLTDVSLSKDLKRAHVFWTKMPEAIGEDGKLGFPDKKEIDEIGKMLFETRKYLKKRIAESLKLRYVPELVFTYDESLERAAKVESLLAETRK